MISTTQAGKRPGIVLRFRHTNILLLLLFIFKLTSSTHRPGVNDAVNIASRTVDLIAHSPGFTSYYAQRVSMMPPTCASPTSPQVITESGTLFQSPHPYREGELCVWLIQAPPNNRILITFSMLDTIFYFDYVYIFENTTNTNCISCSSLCPCVVPGLTGYSWVNNTFVQTTGNSVMIVLYSQYSPVPSANGFTATATFVPSSTTFTSSKRVPFYIF